MPEIKYYFKTMKPKISRVAKEYGLGAVSNFTEINGGFINENYKFKTARGIYIARFIRKNPDEKYLLARKTEFAVLEHLSNKKFKYKTPVPLKNSKGEYLSIIDGRHVWVYEYIAGTLQKKVDAVEIKESAKALAIYHKVVSKLKTEMKSPGLTDFGWLRKQFDLLKAKSGNSKLDLLIKKNLGMFEEIINRLDGTEFSGPKILIHGDFHNTNMLFEKGKVTAILDFDSVAFSLRCYDVAGAARSFSRTSNGLDLKKYKTFLDAYQETSKLSKKEISQLIPLMLRGSCYSFNRFAQGDLKDERVRYARVAALIKRTKGIIKLW